MHVSTLQNLHALAAPPTPVISGFGSVMEKEHHLQLATEETIGAVDGPHSSSVDRILRNQQLRLDENVGLLEERYELLPHPVRFHALQGKLSPLTKSGRGSPAGENIGVLSKLVAQHMEVLGNIAALIAHSPHHLHGELNLNAMARNHEEMAWMLNALLKEDEWARNMVPIPTAVTPERKVREANWENEGGATRSPVPATPPPSMV